MKLLFRPQIYDESKTDQILNAKYFVWNNYTLGKWGSRKAFNQNSLMQLFNGDRPIVDWIVFIADGVDQYSMTSSRRTFLAISSSFAQVMVGHQHHFHFQQKICSQTIFYEWVDLTQLQAMKFFQLLGNGVGFINKTSDLCIIVSLSRPVFSLFVQPEPDWTRPGHQL